MAIKAFKGGWTQVPNVIINNDKLSLKAKGLWLYINSKPESWQFSVMGTCAQSTDGKDSVNSGVCELEKEGYLSRSQKKSNASRFAGYEWTLYDYCIHKSKESIPVSGNTERGKPVNGKPNTSKTIISKTIISKKEREEEPKSGSTLFPSKKIFNINELKKLSGDEVKERFPVIEKYLSHTKTDWKDLVLRCGRQTQYIEEAISFKKEERRIANVALLIDWLEYRKERGKEYTFARSIKAPWRMILGYVEGNTRIGSYELEKAKRAVEWSIESEWLKIFYKKEDLKEMKQDKSFDDRGVGIQ
jgi:hypothetical protein